MNKQLQEELIDSLSLILEKSEILDYDFIEFENDDDVNFFITPTLKSIKKEKNRFNFILYCSDERTLTLYCPTFYKLDEKDSVMFTLNAINNVNSRIAVGKVYLNQNNSSVVSYINRILFEDITKELTVELLEEYVKSFWMTSLEFYNEIKELKNEKND